MARASRNLLKECQTCCIPDAVERVFDSCRLEYDTKYFGDTAEITQFIQAHGAEFPSLKVQHKARMTPKLTLKDASGTESVDVYGWKRDDIHDFLKQKLRSQ